MKKFIYVLALTLPLIPQAWACSCSQYPLHHEEVIIETLRNEFGKRMMRNFNQELDMKAIKAYPTMIEKLDLFDFKGTSCEARGPQNEFLYHCIHRIKFDYLVKLPNCEVLVRATSTFQRAKAKIITSTCQN